MNPATGQALVVRVPLWALKHKGVYGHVRRIRPHFRSQVRKYLSVV